MKRLVLLGALGTLACEAPSSPRPTQPKRAKAPAAKPPKKAVEVSPGAPVPDGPGPLPTSDDPRVRRSAALALLSGGPTAAALPVRATDPGQTFDAGLVRAMTPTGVGRVPLLRQGDYTVEGDLPREVVRRIVRAHVNELRFCYTRQLQRKSDVKGELGLRFTIEPSGSLRDVEASAVGFDAIATKCVTTNLKRWRFPEPGDGKPVEVTYAFALSPG